MYQGLCPGNLHLTSQLDPHRGETQRDFGDSIGTTARALVEGLFGILPDLLRNGWYLENHTEQLGPAVQHGAIPGAAGEGRFASAARADYAAAAAAVLTSSGHENETYELAGDTSYTLADLAAEVTRQAGKPIAFHNLPSTEYEHMLAGFGMPAPLAAILADADLGAARGELDSSSHDLATLIGRATVTLPNAVSSALAT